MSRLTNPRHTYGSCGDARDPQACSACYKLQQQAKALKRKEFVRLRSRHIVNETCWGHNDHRANAEYEWRVMFR